MLYDLIDINLLSIDELLIQGENYCKGINGCEKDFVKASEIYRYLADDMDNAIAQYRIGTLYLNNDIYDGYNPILSGCLLLSSIIEKLREEFLIENNLEAKIILTRIIQDNLRKAKFYLKKSADNGNADAMFVLGQIYMGAICEPQTIAKAREYFVLAVEKNHISAKTRLGEIYAFDRDLETAVKLYQEAAEQGCSIAMLHLSQMYNEGIYFEANLDLSLKWLLKSSELNNPIAQCNMTLRYFNDCNTNSNHAEAEEKLIKAMNLCLNSAEQGYPIAQNLVGLFYYKGILHVKDLHKAKRYFTKAAVQGVSEALFYLANMYLNGEGVTRNIDKAINLYTKAAMVGHKLSRLHLGDIYDEYHKMFAQYSIKGLNAEWVKQFCRDREEKLKSNAGIFIDATESIVNLPEFKSYVDFLAGHYLELEKKWGLPKEDKRELHKDHDALKLKFSI